MAKILLGCYRTGEANDPEIYTRAIVAVLAGYPADVMQAVVDPAGGLPSRLTWLPTVAEVKAACEAEMAPIRRAQQRQLIEHQTIRERRMLEDHSPRMTYEEMQRRCAEGGIFIGEQRYKRGATAIEIDAFKEKHGLTDEQWAAIPNAVEG